MPARGFATFAIALVLIGVTSAAYWPVFSCGFVNVDDNLYVTANSVVQRGLSVEGWKYAWTEVVCANWHPLTMLSLEIDGTLWGIDPAGYHATNLILHVFNVVLLFVVLNQMTASVGCSGWVAALFALHPLHVESVAWVSERKDVLSTLCFLLMLLAYVRYVRHSGMIRYLSVLVLFAIGLLAKPMLVTAPVLLLLLDYWPLKRLESRPAGPKGSDVLRKTFRSLFLEKIPFLVLSFADGIVTILVQGKARHNVADLTIATQIANVFNAYLWYLQKTIVPTGLIAFYPHPSKNLPWTLVMIGVIVVLLVSIWAYRQRRTKPYLLVGWSWFIISLLPVIGLIQVGIQAYADRYAYIPHIGLFVAIVWEIHAWVAGAKWRQVASTAGLTVCVFVCGWLTHLQIAYWTNAETLWRHALDVDPNNGRAHTQLAIELANLGEFEQADRHMEQGFRLATGKPLASTYFNWARALNGLQRDRDEEEKLRMAIKLEPEFIAALVELWNLLVKQGRHQESETIAKQLVRAYVSRANKNPKSIEWQLLVGDVQLKMGSADQALPYFERAVTLNPKSDVAHVGLGTAQMQLGRTNEAKASFLRAMELRPENSAMSHFRLGEILEMEKDFKGARDHFSMAVKYAPSNKEFRERLEQNRSRE